MNKIRILQVVGGMNRGGAETFLMNVLRNIDRNKFEFVFLCYGEKAFDYESEINLLGAKIIRTPDVKEVGILKHIKNIAIIIKKERIDIVHAHTYYNSVFSLIAAKRTMAKVRITHSHNTKSEENPKLVKKLYFYISKFIINIYSTNYFACGQDAGKALFYNKNKFSIINNSIILDDFYYSLITRNQLRKDLGIPEGCTVILHVGRFDKQKNHYFLVDAYNEYLKINSNSRLVLIGDGILRDSIENKVIELGIQNNVMFLGKRPDVNRLYNIADLFLFPSLFEGFGIVLLEAQANGLTFLASDVIDQSTRLTACAHYCSLSYNAEHWAKQISGLDLKRINTKEELKNSGYDMVKNVKAIEHFYDKMLNRKNNNG